MQQQRSRPPRPLLPGGFTVIELLIMLVVLGILATIVVFGVAQFRQDAVHSACVADLRSVESAASAFQAREGVYPTSVGELTASAAYLETQPQGRYAFDPTTGTVRQTACHAG